ncbi:MAG: polysaccharide biosynthesis protein [Kiritimatiellae bacterium]|nr:polysaccharide biosynthesis protein [Kiritimatiellia bacterium]
MARSEAAPDGAAARAFFAGKRVLVTGAGGTIGGELVRQLVEMGARRVVMAERGENALYEIARRVPPAVCKAELADVNDERRMRELFAAERPEIVLHAAAYKHVPMVELNPQDGLRNNAAASRRLGEIARDAGVSRFVFVSTDKAVNPAGAMGVSKRVAEILLMDLNGGGTAFSAVRFGNVLGSSGSVLPLWEEQIAQGGPVTVTDARMKRYFMTLREAAGLVLAAAAMDAREGRIYTLDMGAPVSVLALAEETIRRAGKKPHEETEIVFTGVRPGEKLFEELDVSGSSYRETGHAKIYETACAPANADKIRELLEDVLSGPAADAAAGVKKLAEACG